MRSTRIFVVFLTLLAGLLVSGMVQAQFTLYTDRATFDTENPGLDTEDFEGGTPTAPGAFCAFDGPVDSSGAATCFLAGDLLGGVTYSSDPGPSMVRLGAGIVNNPSNVIAANFFTDATVMTFSAADNTAVGLDLQCNGGTTATVEVFGAGGLITSEQSPCSIAAPTFFGISADESITSISVRGDGDTGEVLDNVSFGAAQVTEPSSIARFVVTKDFSDDNPQDVTVSISCNTGLPLEQSFVITDSQSDPDGAFAPPQPGVTFVVTTFGDGAMDCSITETPVDGYTPFYQASGSSNSVDDDPDLPGCHFSEINLGDINNCNIGNTLDSVTFTVNKIWEFAEDQADFEEVVFVEFTCQNFRFDPFTPIEDEAFFSLIMSPQNPSVDAPPIYPNFGTPATQCRALETGLVSGVESDQGCAEWQIINVGGPDTSCTITNTVFFEGIPTLSQYGLALLALLMMGIGMVGIRRMV